MISTQPMDAQHVLPIFNLIILAPPIHYQLTFGVTNVSAFLFKVAVGSFTIQDCSDGSFAEASMGQMTKKNPTTNSIPRLNPHRIFDAV
jgi:hypothetical protein